MDDDPHHRRLDAAFEAAHGIKDKGALARWYMSEQDRDRRMALAKRDEYGSADLRIMAGALKEMVPVPMEEEEIRLDAHYIEAAIAFYVLGKVSRIVGALGEGRVPSLDSWHDITIYSMMARRVRETGEW